MASTTPNPPHRLQYTLKVPTAMTIHSSRPQPDEGYEETGSQADSEMLYAEDDDLLTRLLLQPADKRKFFAEAIVRSLSNSDKDDVGRFCVSLTHFDPVAYLPHELMLQILSYLPPKDLLSCSTTSRSWRERSHDEKLWRSCFAQEGWVVDTTKLARYEQLRAANMDMGGKGKRKRPVGEAFGDADSMSTPSRGGSSLQGNVSGADAGIPFSDALRVGAPMFRPNINEVKLSWTYLYKQRRRLEQNWDQGHFKTFQLPMPQHPEDGHTECVYTIQHTTRYLVSGSRDKTIRVWDLNTYRLRERAPVLRGHLASVLCLQFDERPEHDIIVSGGSDARIIIWKFSTGEILKQLEDAHTESVLNLRFDDRFIVTCSKDKSIKVWNRRAMRSSDDSLPAVFAANFAQTSGVSLVDEYSLLSTLMGHGAAVNAVMIYGDKIVSASGDRTLRAWDIKTEKPIKNYMGHTKGIACVQFDGRRIVSGSSDNSVRVFDAETQAEVACLQGHSNLVRTVQARFGDLNTVTDEELEDEAKQADEDFFQALENGMQPVNPRSSRIGRNAGSRRPEDMMSLHTKVPPGGGGGRWSKIVSGSYDETIIIWKKDRDGKWYEHRRLHQPPGNQRRRHHHQQQPPQHNLGPDTLNTFGASMLPPAMQTQIVRDAETTAEDFVQAAEEARLAANVAADQADPQELARQSQQHTGQPPLPNTISTPAHSQIVVGQPGQQPPPNQARLNTQPNQLQPQSQQQPMHQVQPIAPRGESNRVFKLQFDARRIISCSQNRMIVGWDFANGDKDLENIGRWSVETP